MISAIKCAVSGGIFVSPSLKREVTDLTDGNVPILTEREAEVLQLIVYGFNNKKISEKLGISLKTVDSHRTSIMNKLGTHTTADLVRYAIKAALVK